MKNFLLTLILVLICNCAYAVPIPLRGVVEGFYGSPWTFQDRADIIDFCRQQNLNAYIYAPKDDPFHRQKWRTPYPHETLAELENLVALAKDNKVRFIFAVSPGLDLDFKSEEDFLALIRKFDAMYKIGVRDFAIFFDDLKDSKGNHHENGELQAQFLNRVQKYLRVVYKDVAPLITVPTEYFYDDMVKKGKLKKYTRDFAANLDPRIIVLYSGRGVVCDGITDSELAEVNKIFNRNVGIWWNYPVNDYSLTEDGNRNVKLALGAVEKLPSSNVTAIFFNPMAQVQMSKIALTTGAIYSNNPATYDADAAWDKALKELFGSLAYDMKIFAEHSRHMQNSWAKVGPPDAPDFNFDARIFLRDPNNFQPLQQNILQVQRSVDSLLNKLPNKYLVECQPQLLQLKRITQADLLAMDSFKAGKLDPRLIALREEITANEKQAIVSEQAARKFIDDVISRLQKRK